MMFQSRRHLVLFATVALVAVSSGAVQADTIYLKNGRKIRTPEARQVGDKVEFTQFGQRVSIPASLVLRIEEDDQAEEPVALPPVVPRPPADAAAPTDDGDAEAAPVDGEEIQEGELPPEENPDYWRERIQGINLEKEEIAEKIVRLRQEERAFLFSFRSTAQQRFPTRSGVPTGRRSSKSSCAGSSRTRRRP